MLDTSRRQVSPSQRLLQPPYSTRLVLWASNTQAVSSRPQGTSPAACRVLHCLVPASSTCSKNRSRPVQPARWRQRSNSSNATTASQQRTWIVLLYLRAALLPKPAKTLWKGTLSTEEHRWLQTCGWGGGGAQRHCLNSLVEGSHLINAARTRPAKRTCRVHLPMFRAHLAGQHGHAATRLPRPGGQVQPPGIGEVLGAVTAAQQHQLVWLLAVGGGGDGAAGVVEAGRRRRQAHLDLLPPEGGGHAARGVTQVQHPQVPKGRAAAAVACAEGEGLYRACWAKAVG